MIILQVLVIFLISVSLIFCIYLGVLTVFSFGRMAGKGREEGEGPRFTIVVPAHNEEASVAGTVAGLKGQDYPAGRWRVVVVADNCGDGTARVAEEAGAEVLVRVNEEKRAKGYALDHAFGNAELAGATDAWVVVDADSRLHPGSLKAFENALAAGERAVQGRYAVANPRGSWRTMLMAVAMGAFNDTRSRGREGLGVSCGLKGNAMCFTADLLREIPYTAHGLVEDAEYTIELAKHGVRVAYVEEAEVAGEMPVSGGASRSQRIRWESGRRLLRKEHAVALLRDGLGKRNATLFELGMDLVTPPLAWVALLLLAAVGGIAGLALAGWPLATVWVALAAVCALSLGFHVLRGWQLSRTGLAGLGALCMVPAYIVWKLAMTTGRKTAGWVRTKRNAEAA